MRYRKSIADTLSKARVVATRAARMESLEQRALLAIIAWDGGGDGVNWHDAANWAGDQLPGQVDDVVIDAPGDATIRHQQGNTSVRSITSQDTISLNGGSLQATGLIDSTAALVISGGALIQAETTARTVVDGRSGVLDGATLHGDLHLSRQDGARLTVRNGLTLDGTATLGNAANNWWAALDFAEGDQTFGGTGEVLFASSRGENALRVTRQASTLTIGPGITIHGQRATLGYHSGHGEPSYVSIVNQGTIAVDREGGLFTLAGASLQNTGTGRLQASAGGRLALQVSTLTSAGPLSAETGSAVDFYGELQNSDNELRLRGAGAWNLFGSMVGGTVRAEEGAAMTMNNARLTNVHFIGALIGNSGQLDHVALQGVLDMTRRDGARLTVRNGLTLDGTATLGNVANNWWAALDFVDGDQSLDGEGEVVFESNRGENALRIATAAATLTIGADVTIRGQRTTLGYHSGHGGPSFVSIVNHGTISADREGSLFTLIGASLHSTSTGTLRADDGGKLTLQFSALTSAGPLSAETGSTVEFYGDLRNSSNDLRLRGGGTWNLFGSIEGGTVRTDDGAVLTMNNARLTNVILVGALIGSSGVLDNVTLQGVLDMTRRDGARLTVRNGLTLDGTATLGNAANNWWAAMDFAGGDQTLDGAGEVLFVSNRGENALRVARQASTLTIGAGITIHGQRATLGYHSGHGEPSYVSIINQGTIAVDRESGLFTLAGASLRNTGSGRLQASAGGRLMLQVSTLTSAGPLSAEAGSTVEFYGDLQNANTELRLRGGGTWTLFGSIEGGSVRAEDGAVLTMHSARLTNVMFVGALIGNSGVLDNVLLQGALDMTRRDGARLTVRNGLTLDGTATLGNVANNWWAALDFADGDQTLDGSGEVIFVSNRGENALRIATAATTLTIGADIAIRGQRTTLGYHSGHGGPSFVSIVNRGTIASDRVGGLFTLNGASLRSTSTGSLRADDGGKLTLQFSDLTSAGSLSAEAGSAVEFYGDLQNANNELRLRGAGSWNLFGSIEGGAVHAEDGAVLTMNNARLASVTFVGAVIGNSGVLDNVTLQGALDMSRRDGARLTVRNGLTIDGTATLGNAGNNWWAALDFADGDQTLDGAGEVLFASNRGENALRVARQASTLTIGAGITIHGQRATLGYHSGHGEPSYVSIVNQGAIAVDREGGLFTLAGASLQNAGTGRLQAMAGGRLTLQVSTLTSAGPLSAQADSTVDFYGDLRNANNELRLRGSGTWNLFGSIDGGTVRAEDGAMLTMHNARLADITFVGALIGNSGVLDNVELQGQLDMTRRDGARLTVRNGLRLDGTATLGNVGNNWWAALDFVDGDQTLNGVGEFVFASSRGENALRIAAAAATLTIGADITVRGQRTTLGYHSGHGGPSFVSVINLGTIVADASNGQFTIGAHEFRNERMVRLAGNAALTVNGELHNQFGALIAGSGTLNAPTLINDGVIDLEQPSLIDVRIEPLVLAVQFLATAGMNAASVQNVANYTLISSGGDGIFNDGNEASFTSRLQAPIVFDADSRTAVIQLSDALPPDRYLLTLDGNQVRDASGVAVFATAPLAVAGWVGETGDVPTRVTSYSPVGVNGGQTGPIDHVDLTFSRLLDVAAINPAALEIRGPLGLLRANQVTFIGDRTYRFEFPLLSANGTYHFALLPTLRGGDGELLNQDLDGTPGESEDRFEFSLAIDTVPPRVSSHSPAGDIAGTLTFADVWFSETIDPSTLSTTDFSLSVPGGGVVAASAVQDVGLNRFRVSFAGQSATGTYQLTVGPDVRDLGGNAMTQSTSLAIHLVDVDLALDPPVAPATITPGDAMTVTWTGRNRSGAQLLGSWRDAVYLSADATWDIGDLRLAVVPHDNGLAENATYTGETTVTVPGVLPDDYYILVRADVANDAQELGETDNLASKRVTVAIPQLPTTGAARNGVFSAANRLDYFAVHVDEGQALGLSLDVLAATGVSELYVSLEAIPTRERADFKSLKNASQLHAPDQRLAITAPPGGATYYVLAYGDVITETGAYRMSANTGPFVLTGITPDRGSNVQPRSNENQPSVGRVIPNTVTIYGAGFDDTMLVEFVGSTGNILAPTSLRRLSDTAFEASLDLPGWPTDTYDVRVRRGNVTATVQDGFRVQSGFANLETRLVLPSAFGFNIPIRQTIWIEYANTGDAPMPAPLFRLFGDHDVRITADIALATPFSGFDGAPVGVTDTVQVIGLGASGNPGVLNPGESGRIPIYYTGLGRSSGYPLITFALGTLTADDVSWQNCFHIGPEGGETETCVGEDWSLPWSEAMRDELRPAQLPADAWNAIWTNLRTRIGGEWGYYAEALAGNLVHLGQLGQTTADVAQLWSYEIAEASASLHPVRQLAGAVDAVLPAQGLPLSFSRVFGNSIPSRYRQGPLGRGWTHNWEIRAEVQPNGDVVLRGPGGADRFFTKQRNGTLTGAPGDFAQLSLFGGGYRLTETDGTAWQFRADGLLDHVQDTNANRITLSYVDTRLTGLTHSNGQQLLLDYNAAGRIRQLTETLGPGEEDDRVTTYAYDAGGEHLRFVTAPGNRITEYSYDPTTEPRCRHSLTAVEYADGTHDFFHYDEFGRLVETSRDGNAERVRYQFDAAGSVTVTDATNRVTRLAFGLGGQLAQVRDGEGNIVNLAFGDDFQTSGLTGPSGERYQYAYDGRGNLTSVTDPLRNMVGFTYHPIFNKLTSFTDARGNGIQYGYDGRGNLETITYADQSQEAFTYYADGNVQTWTNRRGQTVRYTYTAAGQLTTKDYLDTPATPDFRYEYDAAGNLTLAIDPLGTTALTSNPDTDLLERIEFGGGRWFTFEYNSAGQRTRRTDQDGNVEVYQYGAAGRLDTMTDGAGGLIVDYNYDAAGRMARKTLGNGVFTTYEYDDAGNVLHLVNRRAGGVILSRYDYEYDASVRRTSMDTLDGKFLYGYDALGQLTSVTHPGGRVVRYEYDAAGNRIQTLDNGAPTTYATNNLNQYTAVGGVTQRYDADGNLVEKTENGVTTIYTYDIENRLVAVTTPTDVWTYAYDAFGNRIASSHNGVATHYVVDPTGLGNVAAEYDAAGNVIARYAHGFGLLSRTDDAGDPAFYTFQAIGHTSELTDPTGTVLNRYAYDPWGISLSKNETVDNPFEYVGEYGVMNEGNGLEFMRARYYDAVQARFIIPDSIGIAGGLNLYLYANNDAAIKTDPNGLSPTLGAVGTAILLGCIENAQACSDFGIGLVEGCLAGFDTGREGLPSSARSLPRFVGYGVGRYTGIGLRDLANLIRNSSNSNCGDDSTSESDLGGNDHYDVHHSAQRIHIPPGKLPEPPCVDCDENSRDSRGSFDPNDKLAPGGYGEAHHIAAGSAIPYTIRFENKSDATAPARLITISDYLDDDLDLSTFEITEITFAGQRITVPPGLAEYTTQVPLTIANEFATSEIVVQVQAKLNRETRLFTLVLEAFDPATGWYSEDPFVGLLYPNDATGRGDGSVSFAVSPQRGLPSGTEIANRATIVFDFNDPIDTPLVFNTLDALAPTSRVVQLPATSPAGTFELRWTGSDEQGGAGIASFDIYVSIDGGEPILLLDNTTRRSTTITTEADHIYAFYSIARDNVGHVERPPARPDASVYIIPGDETGDGRIDLDDLNGVRGNFGATGENLAGDADADGDVDLDDLNIIRQNFGAVPEFTPGDTNGDHLVDLADLNNVRNNFGQRGEDILGDTNFDGIVDLADLNAVRNNFGATGASATSVPGQVGLVAQGHYLLAESLAIADYTARSRRENAADLLFALHGNADEVLLPLKKWRGPRAHAPTKAMR